MKRREFLITGSATTLLCACRVPQRTSQRFDAVAGHDGYPSLQAAIDAAPADGTQPFRILLRTGIWREKITVDKPYIHLQGEDRKRSIIEYDAWSGQIATDGKPWGTRRSATMTITAPDFAASNLSILNSFDYNAALAGPAPRDGANGFQAVALALTGQADRTSLHAVTISGHQDTLLTDAGHCAFDDCRIAGSVDFIFGAGTAWFDHCEIVSRLRRAQNLVRQGIIAAPSTLLARPFGLVFDHCRLTAEPGIAAASVSLGRPWRPTTDFSDGRYGNPAAVGHAAFMHCWMGAHVDPRGWEHMSYRDKHGTMIFLEPEQARFHEYGSRGPGASSSRRLLTDAQARLYSRQAVLDDWRADSEGLR